MNQASHSSSHISKFNHLVRLKAIAYFIAAILTVHITNITIKMIGPSLHFSQSAFIRFLSSCLMLLPYYLHMRSKHKFIAAKNKNHLILRSVYLVLGTQLWFFGSQNSSLSMMTFISFTIPIFITIFSSIFLKEKVYLRYLVLNFLGIMGVLFIINFDVSIPSMHSTLLLFAGAISFSLFSIVTKKSSDAYPIFFNIFWTSFICMILSFPYALMNWQRISFYQFLTLCSLGLLANLNSYFLLKSYQLEKASFLALFLYSEILFSMMSGKIFFNETISSYTLMGSAIIFLINIVNSLEKTRFNNGENKHAQQI